MHEPLGQLCGVIGVLKMVCTGCLISLFKKMPVACARTTASKTLSSCDRWRSTSSNKSRRPSVASKPGASKLDGVKITFAKSLRLKNLDAIALFYGLRLCLLYSIVSATMRKYTAILVIQVDI